MDLGETHVQQFLGGNMRLLDGRETGRVVQVPRDPRRSRGSELWNSLAVAVLVVAGGEWEEISRGSWEGMESRQIVLLHFYNTSG